MKSLHQHAGLVFALVAIAVTKVHGTVIDEFDTPDLRAGQSILIIDGAANATASVSLTPIPVPGGIRDLRLTIENSQPSNGSSSAVSTSVNAPSTPGLWAMDYDISYDDFAPIPGGAEPGSVPASINAKASVTYGPLSGLNYSDIASFFVSGISAGLSTTFQVSVTDINNATSVSQTLTMLAGSSGDLTFPVANFVGTADMSVLNFILLTGNPAAYAESAPGPSLEGGPALPQGAAFRVDQFSVLQVPEASTWCAGIALFGLVSGSLIRRKCIRRA